MAVNSGYRLAGYGVRARKKKKSVHCLCPRFSIFKGIIVNS